MPISTSWTPLYSGRNNRYSRFPGGNPAWSYMIQYPYGEFSLFVGELPAEAGPESGLFARNLPFEVWVNGAEQPRGRLAE